MATTMTSRMKLSFNFQSHKGAQDERIPTSQSIHIQPEEVTTPGDEQDQLHRASIRAAHDFINDLIILEDRWSSHMPFIRINCPYTLGELHALGNLPQTEGVATCCKLIRVPVIHEEIGLFIWTQLAKLARGPKFSENPGVGSEKSISKQPKTALNLAQLDERFRFDMPASMTARARGTESPSTSPKEVHLRGYFCRQESIDEELEEDVRNEAHAAPRGTAKTRSGKSQPPARPEVERQRSFFSNTSRNGSHVSLLKWSRGRGSSSPVPRASSASRSRSGSLAGRLGSAVGGLGQRVAGVLGDGMSQSQSRSRSRSVRSL